MKLKHSVFTVLCCTLFLGLTGCNTNQREEESILKRRIVNPWTWQENLGFVQGHEVTGAKRILITAGQVSVDPEGNLIHPRDMEKQITMVLDNMETLLNQAGYELSDVIRFTYFTTDIQEFTKVAKNVLIERLTQAGCKPATSLIGVKELFHPDSVVEIEATAVQ